MRNPVTIRRILGDMRSLHQRLMRAGNWCGQPSLVRTGVPFWVRVTRDAPAAIAVYTFGLHWEGDSGGYQVLTWHKDAHIGSGYITSRRILVCPVDALYNDIVQWIKMPCYRSELIRRITLSVIAASHFDEVSTVHFSTNPTINTK